MNEGLRGAQIEQKIIFVNSLFLSTPSVQPLFVLGHPRYSLVGASAAPRSVVLAPIWEPADSHEGHNPPNEADQMLVLRVVGSNPCP